MCSRSWKGGPQHFPCSMPFSHLPAAATHVHAITHTHTHKHTHVRTSAYTHTLSFLHPPTLSSTLFRSQTSATHFPKGLSDPVFNPQFCFSLALIARKIQNHDTYGKHKYYFNLMAPIIAMPGQILHVNAKVKSGL